MLGASTPQGQGAIGVSAGDISALLNAMQAQYNAIGGTNATLSAIQMAGGFIVSSGGATPTLTTDTAANIIAALTQTQGATPRLGQSFLMVVTNLNSGIATVAAGTGVTIVGTATIATVTTRFFLGTITGTVAANGANAISLQSMFAQGSATA